MHNDAAHAPMLNDPVIAWFCAFVVAIYAIQRYNTPDTNRLSTTRNLFLTSGAGYVTASVGMYWLLAAAALKPEVLDLLGLGKITKEYSSPPVLAAVVLTTLLPNTALLKNVDGWLLRWFQQLGRVGHAVAQLADELTPVRLRVTTADIQGGRAWIRDRADVSNDLIPRVSDAVPGSPESLFTGILMLERGIAAMGQDPRYMGFARRQAAARESLRSGFRIFAAQSQAFFVLFSQLAPQEGDRASDASKNAHEHYKEIAEKAWTERANFIAQALIVVEADDAAIARVLARIGFWPQEIVQQRRPWGPLAFLGFATIVALLALVILFPPPGDSVPGTLRAVAIGLTQASALALAVLPKYMLSLFRRDPGEDPPYIGWLLTAAAAALVAYFIDGAMAMIAQAHAGRPLTTLPLSPNPIMAATITLVITVLCDIDLRLPARRVIEGAVAGVVMVFAIWLCLGLLNLPSATAQAGHAVPYAISFALGFVPGALVPHLYRRSIVRAASAPSTGTPVAEAAGAG